MWMWAKENCHYWSVRFSCALVDNIHICTCICSLVSQTPSHTHHFLQSIPSNFLDIHIEGVFPVGQPKDSRNTFSPNAQREEMTVPVYILVRNEAFTSCICIGDARQDYYSKQQTLYEGPCQIYVWLCINFIYSFCCWI